MSEGKQYIPDQFAGREFKTASVTQAKVATKLYKTSSSDPAATDDTGLGYAVGTIWTNTTSGQVFAQMQLLKTLLGEGKRETM